MVVQPFVGRLSDGRSSVRRGENGSGGFMHAPLLDLGGLGLVGPRSCLIRGDWRFGWFQLSKRDLVDQILSWKSVLLGFKWFLMRKSPRGKYYHFLHSGHKCGYTGTQFLGKMQQVLNWK
jgi:hypothetical protein